MKKIAIAIMALLGFCVVLFMGNSPARAAEAAEIPAASDANVVDGFITFLRDKYGDKWETYYNAILEEWGSVEDYLLSAMPDGAPDPVKKGWEAFIGWTRDYWVVIAIVGAVLGVGAGGIVHVIRKKRFRQFLKTANDEKFATVYAEQDKQSAFLIAQGRATMALLGENVKFGERRDELKKAMEELEK